MFESTFTDRWLLLEALEQPVRFRAHVEEQVVGPYLLELVRELEAFQPESSDGAVKPPLSPVLTNRIRQVGLIGITDAEAEQVFAHPRNLLVLQKAVLTTESPYWDSVIARTQQPATATPEVIVPQTEPIESRPSPLRTWWVAGLSCVATAAAVLLMLGTHIANLNNRLADQVARTQQALAQLDSQRPLPLADPADLPPFDERLAVQTETDPTDLPGADPADLPL